MAFLATLPPAIEIREFSRTTQCHLVAESYWSNLQGTESSWKTAAFSRIATLEQGKTVAGVGDFRASEQAAGQLRLFLNKIPFQSLPIPSVVPLSGRGIMLLWESGPRTVEVTAFADGEIVPEAMENHQPEEGLASSEPETLLRWLIRSPEIQRVNAAAR